jgi:hypothetical protein
MLKVVLKRNSLEVYRSKGKREVVEHGLLIYNQPVVYYGEEGPELVNADIVTSWRVDTETPVSEARKLMAMADKRTVYSACTEMTAVTIEFTEAVPEMAREFEQEIAQRTGKIEDRFKGVLADKVRWKIKPEFFWYVLVYWQQYIVRIYYPDWLYLLTPSTLANLIPRQKRVNSNKIAIIANFWECKEKHENTAVVGNEVMRIAEVEIKEEIMSMEWEYDLPSETLDKILVELLPKYTEIALAYKDVEKEIEGK